MRKHNLGFTLLELMLSVAFIALILSSALRYYPLLQYERNVGLLKQSLSIVLRGSSDYYYSVCQKTVPASVTVADLLTAQLITPQQANLINNPWKGDFEIQFLPVETPPTGNKQRYLIKVKTMFPSLTGNDASSVISAIGQATGADPVTDDGSSKMLSWTHLPGEAEGGSASAFWILRGNAHLFGAKPTPITTGLKTPQAACP